MFRFKSIAPHNFFIFFEKRTISFKEKNDTQYEQINQYDNNINIDNSLISIYYDKYAAVQIADTVVMASADNITNNKIIYDLGF